MTLGKRIESVVVVVIVFLFWVTEKICSVIEIFIHYFVVETIGVIYWIHHVYFWYSTEFTDLQLDLCRVMAVWNNFVHLSRKSVSLVELSHPELNLPCIADADIKI